MTLREAAEQVGVTPATLKRWRETGVIPQLDGRDGDWSPAAVAHARLVARLRERGHSLAQIRAAAEEGRLAYGFIGELFPPSEGEKTIDDVAEETGLEPALIERITSSAGLTREALEALTDEDVQALDALGG